MSRLPVVSGDNNAWGDVLNDYLSQSLNSVGGITSTLTATFSASGLTANYHTVDVISGQNELVENKIAPAASGTNQQIGLYLSMTGSNTMSSVGFFRIPIAAKAQTGGGAGADGVEAGNFICQQNLADDVAFGAILELAFNNLKRNDPLNPVDRNHFGVTIDAYGGFSIGPAALAIRTAAANSTWQRGVWIPLNSITAGGYAFDYEGNGGGAVRITAAGLLQFTGSAGMGLQFANGSLLQDNGVNQLDIKGGTSGVRILNSAATLSLLAVGNTGTLSLPQYGGGGGVVSLGAADSGGAGFKLLRVPN